MSAFTGTLTRSDLRLVLQALRNNWPVEPQTLIDAEAFCIQTKLTGNGGDRLVSLCGEVLDAIQAHRRAATDRTSDAGQSQSVA